MATRYQRETEVIADALKGARRVAREASRPTGTETALTTVVAEQAAVDSLFAKDLAQQLEVELGPLPGQIQAALDDAQSALTEAGLARSEAAAAVGDAQQAAADASQAISDALAAAALAAGSNTWADVAPASGDAVGKPVGAVWFQYDGAGLLAAVWELRPLGWVQREFDEAIIPQVAIGTGTYGSLSGSRIVARSILAEHIATLAITAEELAASAVTAVKIAANAVTAEKINAGAVTTVKLDALAVTAEKIAAGAIIAEKIAAGAITTAKLAADAIDGMTITGALIRTAASGQRLQLEAGGLRAFNASNQVTASIAAASGGLSISGSTVWRDANVSNDWGQLLISPATASNPHMVTLQRGGVHAMLTVREAQGSVTNAAVLMSSAGNDLYLHGGADVHVKAEERFHVEALNGIFLDAPLIEFRGDTDWVNVVFMPGWQNNTSTPTQWRIKHGQLQISGRISRTNAGAIGVSYSQFSQPNSVIAAAIANLPNTTAITPGTAVTAQGLLLINADGSMSCAGGGAVFLPNATYLL